jgi:hypothetical protein
MVCEFAQDDCQCVTSHLLYIKGMQPVLLDITAVAARLNLTPRQVEWRAARGRLPAPLQIPKIGRRWSAWAIEKWATT